MFIDKELIESIKQDIFLQVEKQQPANCTCKSHNCNIHMSACQHLYNIKKYLNDFNSYYYWLEEEKENEIFLRQQRQQIDETEKKAYYRYRKIL